MFKTTSATTPEEYLAVLEEARRTEVTELHQLIRDTAPQLEPRIQAGMLAYGRYHYKYASGREGDWLPIGAASQKRYISLYVTSSTEEKEYLAESFPRTPAQGGHRSKLCPLQAPRGPRPRGLDRADPRGRKSAEAPLLTEENRQSTD